MEENQLPPPNPVSPVVAPTEVPQAPPPKSSKKIYLFIAAFVFLLLFSAGGAWAAYTYYFNSPERILAKSFENLSAINSLEFDGSISYNSEYINKSSLITSIVPTNFTLNFSGYSDISDPENPKSDAKISFSLGPATTAEVLIRTLDKKLYFKPNLLPAMLFGFTGDSLNQEVFQNWVVIDPEELKKEYPHLVSEDFNLGVTENNFKDFQKSISDYPPFDVSERLPDSEVDGTSAYHFKLEINKEKFIKLVEAMQASYTGKELTESQRRNLEEGISNSVVETLEIWVAKNSMLPVKYFISFSDNSMENTIDLELVLKNFNTSKEILAPVGAIPVNEFLDEVLQLNTGRQFSQARDTQRRSDLLQIANSIYQFAAEHNGNLPDTDLNDRTSNFPTVPTCIGTAPSCFNLGASGGATGDTIVPTYVAQIPFDPSKGTDLDTGYTVFVGNDGRLVASASGELTPAITVQR